METNESLAMVAFFTVIGTLVYNTFRYNLKLNIPSSLVLSSGVFYSIYCLVHTAGFAVWISEYIWAVIVLGALTAIIVVSEKSTTVFRKPTKGVSSRKDKSYV